MNEPCESNWRSHSGKSLMSLSWDWRGNDSNMAGWNSVLRSSLVRSDEDEWNRAFNENICLSFCSFSNLFRSFINALLAKLCAFDWDELGSADLFVLLVRWLDTDCSACWWCCCFRRELVLSSALWLSSLPLLFAESFAVCLRFRLREFRCGCSNTWDLLSDFGPTFDSNWSDTRLAESFNWTVDNELTAWDVCPRVFGWRCSISLRLKLSLSAK